MLSITYNENSIFLFYLLWKFYTISMKILCMSSDKVNELNIAMLRNLIQMAVFSW